MLCKDQQQHTSAGGVAEQSRPPQASTFKGMALNTAASHETGLLAYLEFNTWNLNKF